MTDMISVIMPVYNVEKYVENSIDSVLSQTYENFELIIVNDGSTDNSLKVVSKYGSNPKIKIINQRNKGLSAARNAGLKYANGQYIYFIDSDDVINHNLFQLIINEFNKNPKLDLVSFNYKEFESKMPKLSVPLCLRKKEILSSDESLQKLINNRIHQMAWSYVAKAKVILDNNIHFSEGRLFEDNNSAAKIFSNCKCIELIDVEPAPYLLRYRNISITAIANSTYSLKELEDELFIFEDEYNTFIMEGNEETVSKAHTWYFNKLNELYIKYYLALYRKHMKMFADIKTKADVIYSKYKINMTLRDRERWLRVNSKLFDKFVRTISGDRRKLQ